MHFDIEWSRVHQAFNWLCPILQGFCCMKACNNRDLGVNGHRCRLPTCPSICLLLGVLPTEAALRMKSSHWTGLRKWQGLMKQHLPCCTICPRAFTPWHLHLILIKDFVMSDYQQACKVWLLDATSIRAWTAWHGQQSFKAWLLVRASIKASTTWHGQQAFKESLLKEVSMRAWTTWQGLQAFKSWRLEHDLKRAWTTWHVQQAFKEWVLKHRLMRASTMWHGQSWSASLRSLAFGWHFNEMLDNVAWPAGIQSLTFQARSFQ